METKFILEDGRTEFEGEDGRELYLNQILITSHCNIPKKIVSTITSINNGKLKRVVHLNKMLPEAPK